MSLAEGRQKRKRAVKLRREERERGKEGKLQMVHINGGGVWTTQTDEGEGGIARQLRIQAKSAHMNSNSNELQIPHSKFPAAFEFHVIRVISTEFPICSVLQIFYSQFT